jgi:hypothetical protein
MFIAIKRPSSLRGNTVCTHLVRAIFLAAICPSLVASASCVNPTGKTGCFSSISAAVAAARPGAIISVAPGTYKEDVVITKSLTLIGSGPNNTIINATSLSNAIYIDGLDNPGLSNVFVSGFTVENANFEGLLVTNASSIIVNNNYSLNNNKNLDVDAGTCTDLPPYDPGEEEDCGEGFHIMGVSWSTFSNNVSEGNSGGFLISDDTGETHDNLITSNYIKGNPFACGIVLASHQPYTNPTGAHYGIVHNTISNNTSTQNGYQVPGAGAGIGLFANGTGIGLVSENTIIGNTLTNNGLPGVAMHSHVGPNFGLPADDLSNNSIIYNQISGNGPDIGDTPTPGPAGININSGMGGSPITGTTIWGNTITNESDDVVFNTPADTALHYNSLLGGQVGVNNLGTGPVDATNNYWGCIGGPGAKGCSTVGGDVTFVPFLRFPFL